jgi:hypothetical protein
MVTNQKKLRFSVMQSIDGNPEDTSEKAFAELFKLFSAPTKSPAKAYRKYLLTFENGEPIFTLSEASRIMEKAFEEIFGPNTIE